MDPRDKPGDDEQEGRDGGATAPVRQDAPHPEGHGQPPGSLWSLVKDWAPRAQPPPRRRASAVLEEAEEAGRLRWGRWLDASANKLYRKLKMYRERFDRTSVIVLAVCAAVVGAITLVSMAHYPPFKFSLNESAIVVEDDVACTQHWTSPDHVVARLRKGELVVVIAMKMTPSFDQWGRVQRARDSHPPFSAFYGKACWVNLGSLGKLASR